MSARLLSFAAVALSALGGCSPGAAEVEEVLPVLVANANPSAASLQALAQGRLHVDDQGCLRVGEGGPFIIWPYGSRISRTAEGRVQVMDGASGNLVSVGEEFAVAGAGVEAPPLGITRPVPEACATGRYWLAGPVMSEAQRRAAAARQPPRPAPVEPEG